MCADTGRMAIHKRNQQLLSSLLPDIEKVQATSQAKRPFGLNKDDNPPFALPRNVGVVVTQLNTTLFNWKARGLGKQIGMSIPNREISTTRMSGSLVRFDIASTGHHFVLRLDRDAQVVLRMIAAHSVIAEGAMPTAQTPATKAQPVREAA